MAFACAFISSLFLAISALALFDSFSCRPSIKIAADAIKIAVVFVVLGVWYAAIGALL